LLGKRTEKEVVMRTMLAFAVLALLLLIGCGEEQCAAARANFILDGHVDVSMESSLASTYDVDLDLDGVAGAFTCS
jgi:hypothetical protein